eukprot:gene13044-8890_t
MRTKTHKLCNKPIDRVAVSSHQITHYNNNELKNLAHSQAQLYKRIRSRTKPPTKPKYSIVHHPTQRIAKQQIRNSTHMSQVYNLCIESLNPQHTQTTNTHAQASTTNNAHRKTEPNAVVHTIVITQISHQTLGIARNRLTLNASSTKLQTTTTCNHIQFMWEAYKTLKCRSLKQQPLQPKFPTHPQTVILKQFKVTLPTHSHQLALYRRKHQLYTSNNRKHPTSKASN